MSNARSVREASAGSPVPRSTLGWLGLLTGPTAWMTQLFTSWGFAELIACAPATVPTGMILGMEMNSFIAIVNALLLALTVLSGLASYVELRRIRARSDPTPGDRATWLATAGIMTSSLFSVLIAVSFVPAELIRRCEEAL